MSEFSYDLLFDILCKMSNKMVTPSTEETDAEFYKRIGGCNVINMIKHIIISMRYKCELENEKSLLKDYPELFEIINTKLQESWQK